MEEKQKKTAQKLREEIHIYSKESGKYKLAWLKSVVYLGSVHNFFGHKLKVIPPPPPSPPHTHTLPLSITRPCSFAWPHLTCSVTLVHWHFTQRSMEPPFQGGVYNSRRHRLVSTIMAYAAPSTLIFCGRKKIVNVPLASTQVHLSTYQTYLLSGSN